MPPVVSLASLPGPPAWPVVGNLPQLGMSSMHERLQAWAHVHGPAYRVRLGPRDALVVTRAGVIAGLLRDRPAGWSRLRSMQRAIQEIGGGGVFSAEGDDWRRQRKLVMAAFDPGHLKRYFVSLARVAQRLRGVLSAAATSGEPVDLQRVLMRFTVDVTAGLAFGIDVNTQENAENAVQAHLDKVFPMLMRRIFAPVPWWRYVRLPSDREFDRHLVALHALVAGFIGDARERMAREPTLREHPSNLLEALIAARDDQGQPLSEQALVGNVLTVLLAGEDTTANTLCWTLYLLHAHRACWQELVAQVDAALEGTDVPLDFETARQLSVAEECVNEAMRLHPVAPLLLLQCNGDTQVEGVHLPRGTVVICVMRAEAVDPRLAADAAQFNPRRWRGAATAFPAHGDEGQRQLLKSSMPFGAGPRLCPGRYLAMLEMKMVLATIARNFELVEVRTPDGAPPRERLAFTMYPQGLQMRLAHRGAGPGRHR